MLQVDEVLDRVKVQLMRATAKIEEQAGIILGLKQHNLDLINQMAAMEAKVCTPETLTSLAELSESMDAYTAAKETA
jgi:hypothetical protein